MATQENARSTRALALAVAGAVLIVGGCAQRPARPPVVLIVIDTLRADHVSCYGLARPTSPALCALAQDGVLFERAYTPRTATTPAMASILTGLPPHRHGVRELWQALPDSLQTLPELLRGGGYETGGFVSSFVMIRKFSGLNQGFDVYDDRMTRSEPYRENFERSARQTVDRALAWLNHAGPHAFLFLHLIEPHGPYTPPQRFAARFARKPQGFKVPLQGVPPYQHIPGVEYFSEFVDRYDGEIAAADYHVGRLLEHIRTLGWYDSALIVVTADHGESMGEEGNWFHHGLSVGDAEAQVPLIVKFSKNTQAGELHGVRVTEPVSLLDILPTVLRETGVRESRTMMGAPLQAVVLGRHRDAPPPLTELRRDGKLTVAAHGDSCSVRWTVPASLLTQRGRLRDTAPSGDWEDLPIKTQYFPPEAERDCGRALATRARAEVEDLLKYRRSFPVTWHMGTLEAGFQTGFVRRQQDPTVELSDADREALRQLGYVK